MEGFRRGTFQVLVATDIAARGIDVSQVAHVINFDIPDTAEAYTHRIGRTGRAEHEGQAHTFVTGEDMSMVRAIEAHMKKALPRREVEGFTPDPEEFRRPSAAPSRPQYRGRPQDGRSRGDRFGNGPARNGGPDRRSSTFGLSPERHPTRRPQREGASAA